MLLYEWEEETQGARILFAEDEKLKRVFMTRLKFHSEPFRSHSEPSGALKWVAMLQTLLSKLYSGTLGETWVIIILKFQHVGGPKYV